MSWEIKREKIFSEDDVLNEVNRFCEGDWEPFALFKEDEFYEIWFKRHKTNKPPDCEHL